MFTLFKTFPLIIKNDFFKILIQIFGGGRAMTRGTIDGNMPDFPEVISGLFTKVTKLFQFFFYNCVETKLSLEFIKFNLSIKK